jgi:hypothetical protein
VSARALNVEQLEDDYGDAERQVPALDNIRPAECFKDPKLIKRLRTALMRMP